MTESKPRKPNPTRTTGWRPPRGYSWPPFEPDNEAALKHGAKSERRWRPIADRFRAAICAEAPWLTRPTFAAAVEAWSVVEAKTTLVDAWLDEHGLLDHDGVPLPANNLAHQLHTRAITLRSQLGLDPTSFARLLASFAAAPGADDVLKALRAEGAAILAARSPEALAAPEKGAQDPPDGSS